MASIVERATQSIGKLGSLPRPARGAALISIGISLIVIAVGSYGDAHGWWTNRPFQLNLLSSLAAFFAGAPVAVLAFGLVARWIEHQLALRRALDRFDEAYRQAARSLGRHVEKLIDQKPDTESSTLGGTVLAIVLDPRAYLTRLLDDLGTWMIPRLAGDEPWFDEDSENARRFDHTNYFAHDVKQINFHNSGMIGILDGAHRAINSVQEVAGMRHPTRSSTKTSTKPWAASTPRTKHKPCTAPATGSSPTATKPRCAEASSARAAPQRCTRGAAAFGAR